MHRDQKCRFASLYKRFKNIAPIIALVTLAVFAMAITPWSAFHQHAEVKVDVEKHCSHQYHLKAQGEICLLCKAHFETDYIQESKTFEIHLCSEKISRNNPITACSYVRLIATALRGPPVVFS